MGWAACWCHTGLLPGWEHCHQLEESGKWGTAGGISGACYFRHAVQINDTSSFRTQASIVFPAAIRGPWVVNVERHSVITFIVSLSHLSGSRYTDILCTMGWFYMHSVCVCAPGVSHVVGTLSCLHGQIMKTCLRDWDKKTSPHDVEQRKD